MTFPKINPLIETFLEPSRIFLFGKRFPTLVYDPTPMSGGATAAQRAAKPDREFEPFTVPPETHTALAEDRADEAELPMPPGPVERVLRQAADDGIFARIYGFSFEGHYYTMPRPVLFLVRSEGQSRSPDEPAVDGLREFNTRFTGVASKDWQFGDDIRVWAVDRYDMAVCLDLEIGTYDQILLDSLAAGQVDSAFRTSSASRSSSAAFRSSASFRSTMVGPHQDR